MNDLILNCTIDTITTEEILLGGKVYIKCKVVAAGEKFTAYLAREGGELPKRGDYLEVTEYHLTNSRSYKDPNPQKKPSKILAALRIEVWKIIPEPVDMKEVRIEAVGAVVKSRNVELKTVGKKNIPFIPVTFLMKNEDGVEFGLLACCFGNLAEAVSSINRKEKAKITARLRRNRKDSTFELNVIDLTLL